MRLERIALYPSDGMHGLRCDPALLGWTRVLDEWVVGLMARERGVTQERVDWALEGSGVQTLAEAVTRVRSFAFREEDIAPTAPLDDGTLRFELQGRLYRVGIEQRWPEAPEDFGADAENALAAILRRAASLAGERERPVAALLLTPRFARGPDLVARSRRFSCSGCAFSFPPEGDARYRHGGEAQPGAVLLIQASDGTPALSG